MATSEQIDDLARMIHRADKATLAKVIMLGVDARKQLLDDLHATALALRASEFCPQCELERGSPPHSYTDEEKARRTFCWSCDVNEE